MKKTVGRSAVIILFGLLQACSVLPRPEVVAVEYFTLDTPAVPTVQPAPAGPVLLIARPQVRPDLDTPRMAYRQQDYTLRYYARSRWSDVPAQLLLPGLIESFESSGQFAAVLRTGSPATPQLRLDTEILEFSLDFRAQPSRFQLRLRAQLVDLGTRRVLASHAFAIEKPLEAQTPYGGAQAANAAWQALLPELVTFCTAALPPVAP
ncbi:MAG TPA: ABC-type transport auxiliary lipoprotein family protein [Gammaproteobacteria bacterium]|nr:ABC-type transport auxiliary lipoprotein family protein [Gammaproteobacteria bacterium]